MASSNSRACRPAPISYAPSRHVRNSNTGGGTFSLGSAHFFCRQPVEVSDRDIDDLAVSFTPAMDLAGAFHADGVKLSKPPFVMLLAEIVSVERKLQADADLNGAFHIAQLPPDRFESQSRISRMAPMSSRSVRARRR